MKLRIAIVGASPCDQCVAACCKQNGHEFAAILDEDERRRFGPFAQMVAIRRSDGTLVSEFVLPYRDGRCQFLGDDDRCTIYDDRPRACRVFECRRSSMRVGSISTICFSNGTRGCWSC